MKKAFTLIELLIVIAILAILAIGILAAIDPIEQFRRGSDSTAINTASEYKNAVDRYYTGKGVFPVSLQSAGGSYITGGVGFQAITEMMTAGELKTNFTAGSPQALSNIYVNVAAAGANPVVCTNLYSKTFRNNSAALYNVSGGTPAGTCPSPTNADCHICYF
ncbi:type II secretion system protein [Candidatus Roizmanbacteria bacterium]|nr:type II secretion system protein [Candidatus Roizmanbacteria bacterium]